jgi:hypothetical protein
MTTRRALLFIPLFLVFMFALILRWQWNNTQPVTPHLTAEPQLKWRAASKAESSAAIAPIRAQLEAFRADDYKTAMKYQSSSMRRQFDSVTTFRSMMSTSYPQFARPRRYTFGAVRATSDATLMAVPIMLQGADGVAVRAEYLMTKEGGGYRVASVAGGGSARRPARPAPQRQLDPATAV